MNLLEAIDISKTYRGKKVLDGVNMCVREGDIYGLVGRNGAGKTTLIRILLGLVKPDGGEIRINGASGAALNEERKKIGSLIDSPALQLNLSALDNMKAEALAFGHYDVEKLKDILHLVGLDASDSLKVKNFSLGMKQRLAIAVALIGDPRILILDEPVNGLDPAGIYEVRELLQRLNNVERVTILISSHLLAELGKVANSYGVIEGGRIVKELRNEELEKLRRPYFKAVVGDLKAALKVLVQNYGSHDFEVMPYNTIAIYDLSKDKNAIASMFAAANVPVLNISDCEGDLESTFISLMGGARTRDDVQSVFSDMGDQAASGRARRNAARTSLAPELLHGETHSPDEPTNNSIVTTDGIGSKANSVIESPACNIAETHNDNAPEPQKTAPTQANCDTEISERSTVDSGASNDSAISTDSDVNSVSYNNDTEIDIDVNSFDDANDTETESDDIAVENESSFGDQEGGNHEE